MGQTPEKQHDQFLWNQFAKLGEMMGDGLHHEPDGKWISREYNKLMKILIPEIKQEQSELRKKKNKVIDQAMTQFLSDRKCECSGNIVQARSGSKVAYCDKCNIRYRVRTKRK